MRISVTCAVPRARACVHVRVLRIVMVASGRCTQEFGTVILIPVGATMVGSIHLTAPANVPLR